MAGTELWHGTVERLGWGGQGIARAADGRLILLRAPLALVPGEDVEAELIWRRRHAEGEVTRWRQEDGRRLAPACPYALHCGGCSLWGVDEALRGELKRQMVADLLRRMLPGEPSWRWLPASTDTLRQRIQLHWDSRHLGYHTYHSHELVPVAGCPIAVLELSAAIPRLQAALSAGALPAAPARWDLATGTPPSDVRASVGQQTWRLSKRNDGMLPGEVVRSPELDDSPLYHHLGTATLQQHPRAFFQVCPVWAWQSFGNVFASWRLGGDTLFDLYGGGGFMSRLLAEQYQHFVLVEESALSVANAANNLTGLAATVHQADVARWLAEQPAGWAGPHDTILLDPPRAGLPPAVAGALASCAAGHIVLIGCDGASFCRDVRRICESGKWRLAQVAVIDLFPNTPQVECVGLLENGSG